MFWKSLVNFGKQALGGLNKSGGGIGGLLNKAKSFVSNGLSALSSKPAKSIINAVSQYIPGAGDAYASLKKYGHMANNLLNGGADKAGERYIKQSPLLSRMDRLGSMEKPADWHNPYPKQRRQPSIERRINREEDDLMGGLFS